MTQDDMDMFLEQFEKSATARGVVIHSISVDRLRQVWIAGIKWRVFLSSHIAHSFESDTAQGACDSAWTWLNAYKPSEDQLAEILGCRLVP